MQFSPELVEGTLIRRYKRFLADVTGEADRLMTIHCPNTGSMRNCLTPGGAIWYSVSPNAKRKYPHTWEIATTPDGHLAGINTHRANGLVLEAIQAGLVPQFGEVALVRREVRYGSRGSRVDFVVEGQGNEIWHVEVKNVTLCEGLDEGFFPDAVSIRGARHLLDLTEIAQSGGRAMLVYCVQHSAIRSVSPAAHIDPAYALAFQQALAAGVEVIALAAYLSPAEIVLTHQIPVQT